MLHINGLPYRIGPRILIDGATVAIPAGHKVGLVGRNGVGKTTLLRIILVELTTEGGTIGLPRHAKIGTVAQEAPGGPESLIDTVLAADVEREALLIESHTARDGVPSAAFHTRLTNIESHSAPARAGQILAGLGFSEEV